MIISKWVVFNNKGKKLRTVTIEHEDGRVYRELDPFEQEIESLGLYAHRAESLDQDYLEGKTFKEKLRALGWEFDSNDYIK